MGLPRRFVLGWAAVLVLRAGELHALEFSGAALVNSQLREREGAAAIEAPTNAYGALIGTNVHHGIGGETYFRLERDWSRADGASDFYLGFARLPLRGFELSLGRQVLDELPGALYVADAGRLRFDRGGPVGFSLFGGQPRYFEPLQGAELVSQDEQMFGGSARLRWVALGQVVVSFAQLQRQQRRLNQLGSATWSHTFRHLRSQPQAYALAAYDSAERNVQQVTTGVGLLPHPRVFARIEGSYYRPSSRSPAALPGLDRFVDPLFSLISASSLQQARCGVQYRWRETVWWSADYGLQAFEDSNGQSITGNRGSVGLVWLPEGDGLEIVRSEFGVTDSRGGSLFALRAYYENRVYQRILFRTKMEVGRFDKITNEQDIVVTSRVGVAYELAPGFLMEVNVEGNRSPRFDYEFRLGAFLTYNLHYRDGWQAPSLERPVLRYPGGWAG